MDIEVPSMLADFEVIEIVDDNKPYHVLLGIDWATDMNGVINLKKRKMMFEKKSLSVIVPLDPIEGSRYTELVRDYEGDQETYSFTDGFSGYHQIKIVLEDRSKTTFTTKWCCFQYTVIPFGLKNSPVIFSRIVIAAFKEFIHKFLEVYFDDWTMYGLVKCHVASLHLMLDTCRRY
eukprot:PITA_32547